MGGNGADIVTARLEMDFKSSAGLGDVLETGIGVERTGNTSMTLSFTTRRLSDGEIVAEGREIIVFVDPETFRPVTVPDRIRADLDPESG